MEDILPAPVRGSGEYRRALTHRSVDAVHNERLEFLGDAVLDCIISRELYERFADSDEGALTQMRAHLVSRAALTERAHAWGVADLLRMDVASPRARTAAAGNALEAIVAAVYLTVGMDAARDFVCTLYGDRLADLSGPEQVRNPKALLQETLQRQGLARPRYERVAESPRPDVDAWFTVCCLVPELSLSGEGSGARLRDAEADAAGRVLAEVRRLHPAW